MVLCPFFNSSAGCRKANSCKNEHIAAPNSPTSPQRPRQVNSPPSTPSKPLSSVPRGVCQSYYQSGRCRFGPSCKFTHARESGPSGSGPSSPTSPSSRTGPSSPTSPRPVTAPTPRGACIAFYQKGQCFKGVECTYQHVQPHTSSAKVVTTSNSFQDNAHVRDVVVKGVSDSLFRTVGPIESRAGNISRVLQDGYEFRDIRDVYQFVNDLMATTQTNLTWTFENGQDVLGRVAKAPGTGPLTLAKIMRWDVSARASLSTTTLSFQRGLLPLFYYLTSDAVIKSTAEHFVNSLYNVVNNCMDNLAPNIEAAIASMIDMRSVSEPSLRVDRAHFTPNSFLQVFKATIQLFYEYLSRQNNACGEHDSIPRTINALKAAIDKWAADMENPVPILYLDDKMASRPQADRVYLVHNVRGDMDRLSTVMERQLKPREAKASKAAPNRSTSTTVHPSVKESLRATFDPPGVDRPGGPRHDNDHADIRDIEILPTFAELISDAHSYLPANIQGAPHHLPNDSMERHLDIMFRLLREDFVSPLRSAVRGLVLGLQNRDPKSPVQKLLRAGGGRFRQTDAKASLDLNLYADASFTGILFNNSHDLVCTIRCPGVKQGNTAAISKKLSFGNLVGIVFTEAFTQRHSTLTASSPVVLGIVSGDVQYSPNGAAVPVSFYDSSVYLRAVERLRATGTEAKNMSILLFEVPGLMVESVRPFLESLKTCEPTSLPFSDILLGKKAVNPPVYADAPGFHYNLSCLFDPTSPVKDLKMSVHTLESRNTARELLRHSRLDISQAQSMVDCLTREVAIVEGPPGTGKSWLGVELVRVLLDNGIQKILNICFTNHALDQFLEHIIDGVTQSVVRVGSRSKNEKVAAYNLRDAAQPMRGSDSTALRRQIGAAVGQRKEIEEKMRQICQQISSIKHDGLEWSADVDEFLEGSFPEHHTELSQLPDDVLQLHRYRYTEDENAWQTVKGGKASKPMSIDKPFIWWQLGEDLKLQTDLRAERAYREREISPPSSRRNHFDALANLSGEDDEAETSDSDAMNDPPESPLSSETYQVSPPAEEEPLTMEEESFLSPLDELLSLPFEEPQSNRDLDDLLDDCNVWNMSRQERRTLILHWKTSLLDQNVPQLASLRTRHRALTEQIRGMNDASTLAALKSRKIIGCTTTGAAKILPLLRSLSPEVLIVEEAGECLEAHVLANLVPSIKHLILIGDHLQLRPHISCYELSLDSRQGKHFRLDESLFERLVNNNFPMSMLTVQRRMRPQISNLIRNHLYPDLIDHAKMSEYPDVRGIEKNVYFLDHGHGEDKQAKDHASKTNSWEVEIVRDLVVYLLKQGYRDIAVLTPYLGQLALVRKSLATVYIEVELDERDAEGLSALSDEENVANNGADNPESNQSILIQRKQVSGQIICRTVDNFQGEEAEVVILTLVRNSGVDDNLPVPFFQTAAVRASIGFLKSPNRTNVALSRAKHGLYMLGNASLLQSQSKMWESVINTLSETQSVGTGFPICCARHGTSWSLSKPGLMQQVAPNGGCLQNCGHRLQVCGHPCPLKCHPDDQEHRLIKCPRRCERVLPCSHPCDKLCAEQCGPCRVPIMKVRLPCNHVKDRAPCHQAQAPHTIKCTQRVEKALLCGHQTIMGCAEDPLTKACQDQCGVALSCGKHPVCRLNCSQCRGLPVTQQHNHACGKDMHCSHSCGERCGHDGECPPCSKSVSCRQKCPHKACTHPCSDPCSPCLEPCSWNCAHRGPCPLPCGQPCSRLPCDRPCEKLLACEHPCPSLCGEACALQTCVVCKYETVKDQTVDLVLYRTLDAVVEEAQEAGTVIEPLATLECGHIFTIETLDGIFSLAEYYARSNEGDWTEPVSPDKSSLIPVRCPHCRVPVTHHFARRYGRIIKWSELDVQERSTMIRASQSLQKERRLIQVLQESIDCEAWAGIIHELKPPIIVDTDIKQVMARRGEFLYGHGAKILTPVAAFRDLKPHGLPKQVAGVWLKAVAPILKIYANLQKVAVTRPPHIKAYEAAYAQLFRTFVDWVARGGIVVNDVHAAAVRYARLAIGSPHPRSDSRITVETTWDTLDLRLLLFEIARAMLRQLKKKEALDDSLSKVVERFELFTLFNLESSIKDANTTIETATKSSSTRQIVQCHLRQFRHVLDYTRFNVDKQLDRIPTPPREEIADIASDALGKARDVVRGAQARYVRDIRYGNLPSPVKRERLDWLKANIEEPLERLEEEAENIVQYAAAGTVYKEVTAEEKAAVVRALNFGQTGHWYRCANGHPFVITECGGAMQTAFCPECNAPIGGNNHRLLDDNAPDRELNTISIEQGVSNVGYMWMNIAP